ncbi:hypothetical protein KP509_24G004500 [Ceratopteris richardii]|uniref:Reverse transcriptase zinc-binding domain-containing protein n=1 Tax=Ceratopteris richardii TaxID=49495 RepID=A0A8T2RUT1_CERRI|nr:hypothetical protein KP509_24G004500 [Ceratopteris richardii]
MQFLQQYEVPLSVDASNPWRDWLFAKHTRWWTWAASTYYPSLLPHQGIAHQCNLRWKLKKSSSWWHARFYTLWGSCFTFKTKIFMWRVFTGHFTVGAFLSKHGLQGVTCPHCASYSEDLRHAFWACPLIQIWRNILFLFPISDIRPTKFDCTFLLFNSDNFALGWIRRSCVSLLLSNIWAFRNSKLFQNKISALNFSWQFCKAKMRLHIDVMLSRDKQMYLALLDAL